MSRIAAIVLAAGFSRRFGGDDKLLAQIDGKPMLEHVAGKLSRLDLHQKTAVIQEGAGEVAALCEKAGVAVAVNKDAANGLGTSIAAGLRQVRDADAVMLVLGDMPFVTIETMRLLIDEFEDAPAAAIIAPVYEGRRGHPVIFGRRHFDALRKLEGNEGARSVIAANTDALTLLPVKDASVVWDIDTIDDLRKLR